MIITVLKNPWFILVFLVYLGYFFYKINKKITFKKDIEIQEGKLDNDLFFVLTNKPTINNIFYYISYQLYTRGVLVKYEDSIGRYSINEYNNERLNKIEEEVIRVYKQINTIQEFNFRMVDKDVFKEYYEELQSRLDYEHIKVRDEEKNEKYKELILWLLFLIVPTVIILIVDLKSEVSLPYIAYAITGIVGFGSIMFGKIQSVYLTRKGLVYLKEYCNNKDSIAEFLLSPRKKNYIGVEFEKDPNEDNKFTRTIGALDNIFNFFDF